MTRTYLTTREQIVAAAKEAIRTMFERACPVYMPADFERAAAFAKAHRDNDTIRAQEARLAAEHAMIRDNIVARFKAEREERREAVTRRYQLEYAPRMPSRPARGGEL